MTVFVLCCKVHETLLFCVLEMCVLALESLEENAARVVTNKSNCALGFMFSYQQRHTYMSDYCEIVSIKSSSPLVNKESSIECRN